MQWNEDENRWDAEHHPFTMPYEEHLAYFETDPGKIRAQCYDLVCNGQESASGSIRIHRADIQARVFDLLGISKEKQQERFGHILEAFCYGAPPHGGFASGIDRLIMNLLDEPNIREVMAFPKMGRAMTRSWTRPPKWTKRSCRNSACASCRTKRSRNTF